MSTTQVRSETANQAPRARMLHMKLEVVAIPVSDVDRAKRFYGDLGWRLDGDIVAGDEFRGVQFTPPGSSCSIHFGTGVTTAAPGSARGLFLVVPDIEAARADGSNRAFDLPTRQQCRDSTLILEKGWNGATNLIAFGIGRNALALGRAEDGSLLVRDSRSGVVTLWWLPIFAGTSADWIRFPLVASAPADAASLPPDAQRTDMPAPELALTP